MPISLHGQEDTVEVEVQLHRKERVNGLGVAVHHLVAGLHPRLVRREDEAFDHPHEALVGPVTHLTQQEQTS